VSAIEKLRAQGVAIELDLVENLTNDEALARYRAADIVFDQCLIGFHGYFALEAMAMGKPVLCFLRNAKVDVLAPDECPIINIRPDTIEQTLADLARSPRDLTNIGHAGRKYIEQYYSVSSFADRYGCTLESFGGTHA
jgi:glycosyltransferase involved in cell wall biosynthesis